MRIAKSQYLSIDTKGLDKLVDNLSKKNRTPVLKKAMWHGASIVQKSIRSVYKSQKPNSDLDNAITMHIYPDGEGAVVRRYYIKGGQGRNYSSDDPLYRAYILNFLEKGAKDRKTKGKGRRYAGLELNRGTIPALKFFSKGRSRSRSRAMKEIEKILLEALSTQAMK
jgi:hypothetical protein